MGRTIYPSASPEQTGWPDGLQRCQHYGGGTDREPQLDRADHFFTAELQGELVIEQAHQACAIRAVQRALRQRFQHLPDSAHTDPDRAFYILLAYYGYGFTLQEIAVSLGVVYQRVGQIAATALTYLHNNVDAQIVDY